MNRKEKELIRSLQGQWLFVVLATLLAIFFGVAIAALYELLRTDAHLSPWYIFILFGLLGVWILDIFSYFFDNLEELRKDPSDSVWPVLRGYLTARYHGYVKIFLKRLVKPFKY